MSRFRRWITSVFSVCILAVAFQPPYLALAKTEEKTLTDLSLTELYRPRSSSHPITEAVVAPPSSEQVRFLSAFFQFLCVLRTHKLTSDRWFREDHVVYLLDTLTPQELDRTAAVFDEVGRRIALGDTNINHALAGAGPEYLIAKIGKIDSDVLRLKDQHKDVIRLAISAHEERKHQLYRGFPYSYHLRRVRSVLKRFGLGPKDSILGLQLGTAAWLHDAVEDTDVTYEQLVDLFGREIADIVLGVTKLPKDGVMTPLQLMAATYQRTQTNRKSRILKVADRIANVEDGLYLLFTGQPSIVQKYFEDWTQFKQILYVPGDADAMWIHLERLLTDLPYAQSFIIKNLHLFPEACEDLIQPTAAE
jgi:hypothetical protein